VSRPRVLLADDHTIVAEGLEGLLSDEFDLVGSVRDGAALVDAAGRLRPDVIVTDLAMPTMNGLEAIRELRRQGNRARIVVLTMYADQQLADEAFSAGATGYLLKHSAGEELITAVHDVLGGGTYVTSLLAGDALPGPAGGPRRAGGRPARLTARRRQVLQMIAEGRTMKEIAATLNVSARTAESHKYQIMQALGARTTADLVRYAVQIGLVPSSLQLPLPLSEPPAGAGRS
jgi:DNA-binding NarL/FixJ family response regulator